MQFSIIACRMSHVACRMSHVACRMSHVAQFLSKNTGILIRKLVRKVNRLRIDVCTPSTQVCFQHNNHPSSVQNEAFLRKAFADSQNQKIIFHSYWYGNFGRKQAMSVKSLLASQTGYDYEVWLWLDKDTINENGDGNPYIRQLKDRVTIREFTPEMVKSVPEFKRVYFLFGGNENLANRSDGFRFWALHEYGGCYFDLDVMFIRSMGELFRGSEFVYSWEKHNFANSAIIFLRKESYMSEYLVKKAARKLTTLPWAVFSYGDKNMKYMKCYECSLFDPLWDKAEGMYCFESFEDFMKHNPAVAGGQVSSPEEMFPFSYAHHWHNCWNDEVEHNSPFEMCERKFDEALGL